jgi:hypothetical protein
VQRFDSAYTASACRIAEIDRQKLTDVIASGDYDCAPPTVAGRARRFFIPDLIALHTYARYTEMGYPSRIAARFACQIKQVLDQEPDAEFVRVVQPIMGSAFANSEPAIDPAVSHISGIRIRHHIIFDLRNTRALIEQKLEQEARIVGNPDE